MGKSSIEKLILSKTIVVSHVMTMLNEVIETICRFADSNTTLDKCKVAFKTFGKLRSKQPINKTSMWYQVKVPEIEDPFDRNDMETSVLNVVRNLGLGEFNNVFEAKQRLMRRSLFPANFQREDLFKMLLNFQGESDTICVTITQFEDSAQPS